MTPVVSLATLWFVLIAVLWTGYFFLEGFDFGVGILTPFLARDDLDRRMCINTIGPTWDANEVWLLVAGGATFAAFPVWYATMFSGFYLALFLLLFGLIIRGVSLEYRGKEHAAAWRAWWDRALFVGSLIPALLWGVAFTDLVHGLQIGSGFHYTGGFFGLLQPVALVGGVAGLALFSLHGAVFLSLKTSGELAGRARAAARLLVVPTAVLVTALVLWAGLDGRGGPVPHRIPATIPWTLGAVAVVAVGVGGIGLWRERDGWTFAATGSAIVALTAAAFTSLFPRVMVSTATGRSLTVWNASSAHETLLVMSVVAAIFTPLVLAYQAWSYWVFRGRITRPPVPDLHS
jgi:cytochrome d ubiquinol oxidase subunit II